MSHVTVAGLPRWVPTEPLLGGEWSLRDEADGTITAEAERTPHDAADLAARLRGVGLGGRKLEVTVAPPLPRALVRAARTEDARRRRDTTPGFTRPGVRLDDEGRMSLTPEALALDIGRRATGRRVLDAFCGAGGNAIGFARAGCIVTAVDRDAGRLELARHNARIYGVERSITFVHGDALAELPRHDLVFLDPPWGADWDRTRTTVQDLPPLEQALGLARGEAWIKVPPSFDPSTVVGAEAEAWFGRASGDRRRIKFVLLRRPAGTWDTGSAEQTRGTRRSSDSI